MADNTTLNTMSGGDVIAADDIGGVKYQLIKVAFGALDSVTLVGPTNPLPVAAQGATITGTSGNIAAAGTGTIGPLDVSKAGNVTFIAKNQTAGTAWAGAPVLVFEQSDDSTSWTPLTVVRSDNNTAGSTFTLAANSANVEIMFDAATEGVNWVRCRVTTGPTTNPMTIVIQPGGMPFSPLIVTVPYGPSAATGNGPASVTAAITDTLILAANPLRRGFMILNDSTATLSLSYGTNAASATARSVIIASSSLYEDPFNYRGMVRGIWSAANGAARVTEVL